MSNAWFYYVLPLGISTAFVFGGLKLFRHFARGDRDGRENKYGQATGCGGVLLMTVGGTIQLGTLLTSPTPWARQRLFDHVFHTPPERIERLVIKAGSAKQYQPLARSDVVIDDPA